MQMEPVQKFPMLRNFPPKAKETKIFNYPVVEVNGLFGLGIIFTKKSLHGKFL